MYNHFQLNMQNNTILTLECTHYETSKFLIGSDLQGYVDVYFSLILKLIFIIVVFLII